MWKLSFEGVTRPLVDFHTAHRRREKAFGRVLAGSAASFVGGEGLSIAFTNGTAVTGTVGAAGKELRLSSGAVLRAEASAGSGGPWSGAGITAAAVGPTLTVMDASGQVVGSGSVIDGAAATALGTTSWALRIDDSHREHATVAGRDPVLGFAAHLPTRL